MYERTSSSGHAREWPSVCVIVPSRGRPQLRARAIRRIVDQDYEGAIECLVVFDGAEGEDRWLPSVEETDGRSLRAIDNTGTPGLPAARNAGARATTCQFLAFCDDDDEWLPGKLRRQVETLTENEDVSAVCCGIEVVYRDRTISRVPQERVTFEQLLESRIAELHSSTILVSREDYFGRVGPFDEQIPGAYGEDYEWLLRAARAAPVAVVPEPLARIHWHDKSFFDGRWRTMIAGLRYVLDKYPDFGRSPRGLARIHGQLALASAAAGQRSDSRRWIRETLRRDWRQPRGYLALLAVAGILPPERLLRLLHQFGRGI
jgi:glycosyltransferase involved in cell wall biosynthesis